MTDAPAPTGTNPENLFAAVETIDTTARKVTVCDADQVLHPLVWEPGYLDAKMAKLKTSYYRCFSVKPEGEARRIISIQWIEKQDIPAWVGQRYKSHGSPGGGRPSQPPRNEKAIMYECCLKAMVDLYLGRLGNNSSGQSFETSVESVIGAAKKATEEGIKVSGLGVQ